MLSLHRSRLRHGARTLLAIALGLTLASGCGGDDPAPKQPLSGERLYAVQGCKNCHKLDGAGGPLGPSLAGVPSRWTVAEIAEYVADPPSFHERKPHLAQLARRYSMRMPAVRLAPAERERLATYVMELAGRLGD